MGSGVTELVARARARIQRHTPEHALALVKQGALLVDIRPAAQRAEHGEVPFALVIERNVLEWRLDPSSEWRVPEASSHQRVVIVLCQAGFASSLAAATLRDLGYSESGDVDGGFEAWRARGLPVTSSRASNPG